MFACVCAHVCAWGCVRACGRAGERTCIWIRHGAGEFMKFLRVIFLLFLVKV